MGISVTLRVRGLDLDPLKGLEKALRLTHGLGVHRVHAICMGMHAYSVHEGTPILLH